MNIMKHTRSTRETPLPYSLFTESQLQSLGERLSLSISPISQRSFAKIWGLSPVSLGRYINGTQSPRIDDLARFAKITNTDLMWLIAGEQYAQRRWLQSNQFIEICPDNTMAPTINVDAPVVLETIRTEWPVPDGVYCVENAQGNVFRRLQWDEEKQGFWLRCDNPHFEPQFAEHPSLIGKAVGAVTCVL
ncbi:hypothetical protein COR52_26290 [Vibrio mediterranei]|uniref:HTH cro/C1-type domain-containing protein n=2 Tax=Vibrio mediterranei TaxID=689 RepID=A0ABX5D8N9_9VIBR|nr:hypothetical protein COR52_26290 [Vibrio mediterranei]PRQ65393.1 hypothetical protein COR51_22480 [Vibrio mediterranei]